MLPHTKKRNNKGSGKKLREVMDMFMALMVVMVSPVCIYPQTHRTVYIKYVQLPTCQKNKV